MNTALAEIFPAGEHLADELDSRGWTQAEFAEILGRPAQFVSEIVSGRKEITRESAAQIGAALGTSAEFWLNLQDAYFLWRHGKDETARKELDEVRLRARLNELAPMSVLRKCGIVTSTTTNGQVAEVMDLFKLKDIMDEPRLEIAARRTNTADPLTSTQKAWLACVEKALPAPPSAPYAKASLDALAESLSRRMREPLAFSQLPSMLAEVGVRLVYVEAFPSSKISGASFLLDSGPAIALSGRGQRLDKVLFTLLHEIAHIVRGDVDKDNSSIIDEDAQHTLGNEADADDLAGRWAVPQSMPALPVRVNQEWVDQVADSMGVHPIVVTGRLQKEGVLAWRSALAKDAPSAIPYLESWKLVRAGVGPRR